MLLITTSDMLLLLFYTDSVAYSSRISQHVHHWRELLLSAECGRFHNRSLQAWSCGKSDTLPSFRMLDGLPTYRPGLFFNMFAGWSRHYSVQPLKHTEPGKKRDFSEPSADAKPIDSVTDINSHVESYSSDSIPAAARSEQQHSDAATGVQQQTLVDSNKVVSQIETSGKVGLMQRFRMMYKQYGAVLVSVHTATSAVWISMFYCATVRYGYKWQIFSVLNVVKFCKGFLQPLLCLYHLLFIVD